MKEVKRMPDRTSFAVPNIVATAVPSFREAVTCLSHALHHPSDVRPGNEVHRMGERFSSVEELFDVGNQKALAYEFATLTGLWHELTEEERIRGGGCAPIDPASGCTKHDTNETECDGRKSYTHSQRYSTYTAYSNSRRWVVMLYPLLFVCFCRKVMSCYPVVVRGVMVRLFQPRRRGFRSTLMVRLRSVLRAIWVHNFAPTIE